MLSVPAQAHVEAAHARENTYQTKAEVNGRRAHDNVLARLLAPPKLDTSNAPTQPLIEVIDSQDGNDDTVSLQELSQDQRDLLEGRILILFFSSRFH